MFLVIIVVIGEGQFGKVYTAVNIDTGVLMAMKEVYTIYNMINKLHNIHKIRKMLYFLWDFV